MWGGSRQLSPGWWESCSHRPDTQAQQETRGRAETPRAPSAHTAHSDPSALKALGTPPVSSRFCDHQPLPPLGILLALKLSTGWREQKEAKNTLYDLPEVKQHLYMRRAGGNQKQLFTLHQTTRTLPGTSPGQWHQWELSAAPAPAPATRALLANCSHQAEERAPTTPNHCWDRDSFCKLVTVWRDRWW